MILRHAVLDHHYRLLIDAGYLSWIFGTKPNWGGWLESRLKYRDSLMVLDSPHSVRQAYYSDYKGKRKEKRDNDPEVAMRREWVSRFRDFIREDSIIPSIEMPGAEADDLVAMLWLKGYGDAIIGIDKDFLQVPNIRLMDAHGNHHVHRKVFPKYVRSPVRSWAWVLCQSIFGDKSDSIPRLMPSNGFIARALWGRICRHSSPYDYCAELFGHSTLLQNLLMVLVPTPLLRDQPYTWDAVVPDILTGQHWHPNNWAINVLQYVDNDDYN